MSNRQYNPQRINEARNLIINELPLSVVISSYGIPIFRDKIVCPFHEDDNPSCFVSDERKTYHCFGCGAKGTVVEFVHDYEGIYNTEGYTQAQAIIDLSQRYDIEIPDLEDKSLPKPERRKRVKREVDKSRIITKQIERYEQLARGLTDNTHRIKVYTILDNYYIGRLDGEFVVKVLRGEFKKDE